MGWRFMGGSHTSFKQLAKDAWHYIVAVPTFISLMHVTETYAFSTELTSGPSMAPTLNNDGDVLLVERLSSRHGRIYPGDIVIACSPQNPNIKICKRVIGLEGDHISFHPNVGSRKVITVTVPKGHVWLQGDNIMHSQDSRHYGPVPFALLKGKVWMRIWPIDGLGRLD